MISPLAQGRKYGRSQPAALPAHRMLSRVSTDIPPVVDLRAWDGPIKNQQNLGSCTGHAFASSLEWIFRKYLNKQPILSPLYVYAKELIAQGDFPDDDGSNGVTGCGVVITNGCCEDSLYPDASQKILAPTAVMDENAAQYRMGAYHGLTGSQVALSVIGDPTPWPIQIGVDLAASFESDEVAQSGIYNPQPGESIIGGHELKTSGYDIGVVPKLRPANCPPAILVQNSWGTDWGLDGYVWITLPVFDLPSTDLKITHSGHPWAI